MVDLTNICLSVKQFEVEVEVEVLSPVNQQHRRGRLGRRAHWRSGFLVGDGHGNRNNDCQTMIIKQRLSNNDYQTMIIKE